MVKVSGDGGVQQRLSVAALDADLADRLGPQMARLTLSVRRAPVGPFHGPSNGLGTLVARGLLAHGTCLSGQRSVVMAWAGDVITPPSSVPAWTAGQMSWEVLEPAVVADLDASFTAAVAAHPEALTAVVERISRTTARALVAVALSQAARVEDRLLALLLVMAEERGRVTSEGVCVPAFLTHERLGELIGAARPTVSLAFSRLRERRLVEQRSREWIIAADAMSALGSTAAPKAGVTADGN
jgi:hypothetical protein